MVWVYMGVRETPPPFPAFDVNLIPEDHAFPPVIMMEEANWFQNLEGDTDSVHLDWLHARLRADVGPIGRGHIRGTFSPMKNPFVQAKPAEYGAFYTARRRVGDTDRYWHRINQFIFPIFTMVEATPTRRTSVLTCRSTTPTPCSFHWAATETAP